MACISQKFFIKFSTEFGLGGKRPLDSGDKAVTGFWNAFVPTVCFQIRTKRINALRWQIVEFLGALARFQKADGRPSVWPHRKTRVSAGRIFMKFSIWVFFEELPRKFKFYSNWTKTTGTLHEDQYTFLVISGSFLRRMRNVSNEICGETRNAHFILKNVFPKIVPFIIIIIIIIIIIFINCNWVVTRYSSYFTYTQILKKSN